MDTLHYTENSLSKLAPYVCADGYASSSKAECVGVYNACLASAESVDASAVNSMLALVLGSCLMTLPACNGATVGQVSQCVFDTVTAEISASLQITPESACASANGPAAPAEPASCAALGPSCKVNF